MTRSAKGAAMLVLIAVASSCGGRSPGSETADAGLDAPGVDVNGVPDSGDLTDASSTEDVGSALAPVGAACEHTGECAGGMCLTEGLGFPGGYCTHLQCELGDPDASCLPYGGDGVCVNPGGAGGGMVVCLDRCDPSAPDCWTGYDCRRVGVGVAVCLPSPVCGNGHVEVGEECEPPGTATCSVTCQGLGQLPVGAPCTSAMECAGNYCISAWPAGYCTRYDCDVSAPDTACAAAGGDGYCSQLDCDVFAPDTSCQAYGSNAVCGVLDLLGPIKIVCLLGCQNDNDCRAAEGYTCGLVGIGTRGCVPP